MSGGARDHIDICTSYYVYINTSVSYMPLDSGTGGEGGGYKIEPKDSYHQQAYINSLSLVSSYSCIRFHLYFTHCSCC